jgi:hypothetical protein
MVDTPLVPANPDAVRRVATIGPPGASRVAYHIIERERLLPIVQVTSA